MQIVYWNDSPKKCKSTGKEQGENNNKLDRWGKEEQFIVDFVSTKGFEKNSSVACTTPACNSTAQPRQGEVYARIKCLFKIVGLIIFKIITINVQRIMQTAGNSNCHCDIQLNIGNYIE